jgi:hypothetical protein
MYDVLPAVRCTQAVPCPCSKLAHVWMLRLQKWTPIAWSTIFARVGIRQGADSGGVQAVAALPPARRQTVCKVQGSSPSLHLYMLFLVATGQEAFCSMGPLYREVQITVHAYSRESVPPLHHLSLIVIESLRCT